ncbi:MAG: FecR domain-containing protein [Kiritimatiellae bacterium]|nr:FecR domain-containing protein [Kiritimatiellia bacterium]
MSPLPPGFEESVCAVFDGTASEEQRQQFSRFLREDPGLLDTYIEQGEVHAALLTISGAGREAPDARPVRLPERGHGCGWWKAVAAAAAALLTGAGLWYGVPHLPPPASRLPSPVPSASPVTLMAWKGAWGWELPQELPGKVSLAKGQLKVRLPSGVEMSLLGPLEMQVESGMEVRLVTGRLVAWVPPRAGGFTVRAPGLTAWDIGTVFSVAADAEGSSLFVFKGSVQALDGEGAGVDICGAGEGVRAVGGRMPFKVVAEGETGGRLFKEVRGYAAVAEPQKALDAARRIEELWIAKYVPEEAERVREAARRQAALRNAPPKVPFTKTAWVRPSAPRQKEGAEDMSRTSVAALTSAALIMGTVQAGRTSGEAVVNTSPFCGQHWMTVYTNAVPLVWEPPAGTDHARLDIVGMNRTVTTNFSGSTSNWVWSVFESDEPPAEDIYELTLTFYTGSDAVAGALTSRLAVVTGAYGGARVDPVPASTAWSKVRENAVIPYDSSWAEATYGAATSRLVIAKQNGLIQTNVLVSSGGYFGWRLKQSQWGYGTFNLALSFPGTVTNEWEATLARTPEGFLFGVR